MIYRATYSPEDNKLRLYASARLDAETYGRVKAAGFIWAPKQDLFVAPMWTPSREDLLIELAGEIEDEDRSLVDRAEERADRFSDYKESRIEDAQRAHARTRRRAAEGQGVRRGRHALRPGDGRPRRLRRVRRCTRRRPVRADAGPGLRPRAPLPGPRAGRGAAARHRHGY